MNERAGPGRARTGAAAGLLAVTLALGACWRIGEPTESAALVTWAAYPDTVVVGAVFSFEFAGPVTPNTCGRLDTAIVTVGDSTIDLSARRSVYDTACSRDLVSFYEARPLRIERSGAYQVRTAGGRGLGRLVAVDSGSFSRMRTQGEGTVREVGGCWLFGPGWLGNQRPFALRGAPPGVLEEAEERDRILHVEGSLAGFALCGAFGSRPSVRVDTAWVEDRGVEDYYAPRGGRDAGEENEGEDHGAVRGK